MENQVTNHIPDNATEQDSEMSTPQNGFWIFHLILLNERRDHILGEVLPNGVGRLPSIRLPERVWGRGPCLEDSLEEFIEAELGISVYILRELLDGVRHWVETADGIIIHFLHLGDILDDDSVVMKPFEWIHGDVACKLRWPLANGEGKDDHVARKLDSVFKEINGETQIYHCEPWKRVGWIGELTPWIREMLKARGMVLVGRIRQRYHGLQSLVLTCEARLGGQGELEGKEGSSKVIFIKCTVPLTREVERTAAVAGVIGNIVPEIVGLNERKGILMQRNGGQVTDEGFDQMTLIETILKIQTISMNHLKELEAGGLRIRDSEWVESNVESLLNHELLDEYCRYDCDDCYVNEENMDIVDKLRSEAGEIRRKCQKVTELGLPRTLVHGDMHLHNVGSAVGSGSKVYHVFDWAKSFIGNPLHDFTYVVWISDSGGSIVPGLSSMDLETVIRRICKQWKVCATLTLEEIKSIFRTLSTMELLIELDGLIEQYEACDRSYGNWKSIILRELDEFID